MITTIKKKSFKKETTIKNSHTLMKNLRLKS